MDFDRAAPAASDDSTTAVATASTRFGTARVLPGGQRLRPPWTPCKPRAFARCPSAVGARPAHRPTATGDGHRRRAA